MTFSRNKPGSNAAARPVSGLLDSLPIADKLRHSLNVTSRVTPIWDQNIEAKLREHTQLAHFEDGVLVVTADSPLWANLLHHQQQSILSTLQQSGLTMIRHIYIRTAPRQRNIKQSVTHGRPDNNPSASRSLEIAAKSIEDPTVRQALNRLADTLSGSDQSPTD